MTDQTFIPTARMLQILGALSEPKTVYQVAELIETPVHTVRREIQKLVKEGAVLVLNQKDGHRLLYLSVTTKPRAEVNEQGEITLHYEKIFRVPFRGKQNSLEWVIDQFSRTWSPIVNIRQAAGIICHALVQQKFIADGNPELVPPPVGTEINMKIDEIINYFEELTRLLNLVFKQPVWTGGTTDAYDGLNFPFAAYGEKYVQGSTAWTSYLNGDLTAEEYLDTMNNIFGKGLNG